MLSLCVRAVTRRVSKVPVAKCQLSLSKKCVQSNAALSIQFHRNFGSPARKPYHGNRVKYALNFEERQERENMTKPDPNEPIRVRAKVKNVRTSGKKMIHMARLITGMKVDDAMAQLYFIKKRRAHVFQRAIQFACSVADNDHDINQRDLRIEEAVVNLGPVMKRMRFHGRGKTGRRDHHHCHISVVLVEDTPETRKRINDLEEETLQRKIMHMNFDDEDVVDGGVEEMNNESKLDAAKAADSTSSNYQIVKEPALFPGFRARKHNQKYLMVEESELPTVKLSRRMAAAPNRYENPKEKWSMDTVDEGRRTWRSRFLKGNRGGSHDKDLDINLTTKLDVEALHRATKFASWGAKAL